MPAVSKAQARLMQAAAHSKSFAKKIGIPMSTAKEFMSKQKTPYAKLPSRKK
jgi:hypothetical protein